MTVNKKKSIQTLVDSANMSDRRRWDISDYKYPWTSELNKSDNAIISSLAKISYGEISGLGAMTLFYKMWNEEAGMKDDKGDFLPHFYDITQVLMYGDVIKYEEFRHGLILGTLTNPEFIGNINSREFSKEFILDPANDKTWDGVYGFLLTFCLSEITNAILYKSCVENVKHPELKKVLKNIQADESRHLIIWKKLLRDLANADDFHMNKFVEQAQESLEKHNAMLYSGFGDGLRDTIKYFSSDDGFKMFRRKYTALRYILGDNNPITKKDIMLAHAKTIKKMR